MKTPEQIEAFDAELEGDATAKVAIENRSAMDALSQAARMPRAVPQKRTRP
jgi:hypothetical protein